MDNTTALSIASIVLAGVALMVTILFTLVQFCFADRVAPTINAIWQDHFKVYIIEVYNGGAGLAMNLKVSLNKQELDLNQNGEDFDWLYSFLRTDSLAGKTSQRLVEINLRPNDRYSDWQDRLRRIENILQNQTITFTCTGEHRLYCFKRKSYKAEIGFGPEVDLSDGDFRYDNATKIFVPLLAKLTSIDGDLAQTINQDANGRLRNLTFDDVRTCFLHGKELALPKRWPLHNKLTVLGIIQQLQMERPPVA